MATKISDLSVYGCVFVAVSLIGGLSNPRKLCVPCHFQWRTNRVSEGRITLAAMVQIGVEYRGAVCRGAIHERPQWATWIYYDDELFVWRVD